jgi:hypothetical protein
MFGGCMGSNWLLQQHLVPAANRSGAWELLRQLGVPDELWLCSSRAARAARAGENFALRMQ